MLVSVGPMKAMKAMMATTDIQLDVLRAVHDGAWAQDGQTQRVEIAQRETLERLSAA